ncbi:lipopolysaccharide biosynthesis protein [Kocuria rosea]|uniref:lipopolysaccharide biosynthesis protein n=1 Tax=Kocuria rosea TaxID=1275 RepID=UPI001643D8DD|nr:oligosaccharide flippase family protein [Kocuria rosea]
MKKVLPVGKPSSASNAQSVGATPTWASKMVFSLMGNLGGPIAGLLSAPILARGLGVDGRGELAAANAPLMLATAIGLFGLQESLTFYVARYKNHLRSTLLETTLLVAGLGIIASMVIWFSAAPLAGGNEQIESLIKVAALATLPNFLIAVPRALVAGTQQWHLQAIESGLFGILRLVLLLALYLTGTLTTFSALLVAVGAPVLSACFYFPYVRSMWRQRNMGQNSRVINYRNLLGYGFRVWVGSMSGVLLSRIDQLLMVPLSDATQLGLYAVAVTVGEIPVLLSFAMRNVVFAADATDAGAHNSAQLKQADRRLHQTARIATFLTLLAAAGVGATVWWWLPLIFGEDYAGAVPLVLVLVLAAVLGATGSVAGAGLSARGRPGLRSVGMTVGAISNIVVLVWLVPQIGAMGAAISTVVGSTIAGSMNVLFLRYSFGHKITSFYGLRRSDFQLLTKSTRKVSQ